MDLKEFRQLIDKEFGKGLEHATPANVREFLDRMQLNVLGPHIKGRIVLEEEASTHEEVMKDFFRKVLDMPRDEAVMLLWLLSFDLVFSAIELQHADVFSSMFRDLDE
ncbi:MAG: hypothetical protein ACYC2Y_05125 [Armatimonadota bacterium]